MFKHNILNLVLFIVLVSLASTIYFSEEVDNTQLATLTNTRADDVTAIVIRHNGSQTRLQKINNDQWQITQPVAIEANNFRVSSILKLLNAPVHSSYPIEDINLVKVGLEDSRTSIQLDQQLISFGITNPATKLRYVKLNNNIYTIEDVYYPLLTSYFGTLVSLNLLPADSKIEKLILPGQTISKDDNGLWQSNIDIDADSIVEIIQSWQQLQAFGIHEYMPRDSLGDVFIYLENQPQAINYVITDTDPWLILARPDLGLEYHLDIEAYKKLIVPQ